MSAKAQFPAIKSLLLLIVALTVLSCSSVEVPPYASRLLGYPHPEGGLELDYCGVADDPQALSCFAEAVRNGRPAEIVTAHMTAAGDPVFDIVRQIGPGLVKVYEDRTQDREAAKPLRQEITCRSVAVDEDTGSIAGSGCDEGGTAWEPVVVQRSEDRYMPTDDGHSAPHPDQQNLRS
ncbi:MAG: hypothetical protein WBZ45_11705 [Acidimicrobiia bacterium]